MQTLLAKGADVHAKNDRATQGNALKAACLGAHASAVRILLENGADVNAIRASGSNDRTDDDRTALQAACGGLHHEISKVKVVQMLLDYGADVNVSGSYEFSESPLELACSAGCKRLVQMLLENGADVNYTGGGIDYHSPLHAAWSYGDDEIIRMLLDRGADSNKAGNGDSDKMVE